MLTVISEYENSFIDRLKELNFKGIIVLDDVFHHPDNVINRCMNELWVGLEGKKLNVTKYGHWSGTGILVLDDSIEFELV